MCQNEYPINPEIIQQGIGEPPFYTLRQIPLAFIRIFENQPQRAKENPIQHCNKRQNGDNQDIAEDP